MRDMWEVEEEKAIEIIEEMLGRDFNPNNPFDLKLLEAEMDYRMSLTGREDDGDDCID